MIVNQNDQSKREILVEVLKMIEDSCYKYKITYNEDTFLKPPYIVSSKDINDVVPFTTTSISYSPTENIETF